MSVLFNVIYNLIWNNINKENKNGIYHKINQDFYLLKEYVKLTHIMIFKLVMIVRIHSKKKIYQFNLKIKVKMLKKNCYFLC